jgi:hypothetical protein
MFYEDVARSIAPIGGRSDRFENFKYEICGSEIDKAKSILVSLSGFKEKNINALVSDALNALSSSLFYSGCSYYQIASDEKGVVLIPATSKRLFRIGSYYFQVIPEKDKRYFDNKKILFSNSKNIVKIHMPQKLYSLYSYKLRKKALKLADSLFPEFSLVEIGKRNSLFDISSFKMKRIYFMMEILYKFHWPLRSLINDHVTEFYLVYQNLEFKIVQTEIRMSLLAQINLIFKKLKIDASIEEHGLPTVDEISSAKMGFLKGERGLELINEFSFYKY